MPVGSLGWENPLEEGMATRSSILAWRIPMDRGSSQATVHGIAKSQTLLKPLSILAYFCPPLREPPSRLPPLPTPLGCYRALV